MSEPTIFTVEKTNRGFEYCNFTDHRGEPCSIQQSSACTDENIDRPGASYIWLGMDDDRMHLDRETVVMLVLWMSCWLEYGSFTEPADERQKERRSMSTFNDGGLMEKMSLRDYLAGQALTVLLATRLQDGGEDMTHPDHAAAVAYDYADAMIRERQKGQGEG